MINHLLIIDDDLIFRLLTKKMLEKIDHILLLVQECEDGSIGLKAIEKLSNTNDKVIVFLDINMPVLNGWGFLDALAQHKNYNIKDISVFIVSSSTDESDMIKVKDYDIVERFIHKPLDMQTIRLVFNEG